MRDVVKLPALFKLKPVLIRAFTAAKDKVKSKTVKSFNSDDYVTKGEFRFLLKYLRTYYELWVAFDRVDTGNDNRINYEEFIAALPLLKKWGIDTSRPLEEWRSADKDGFGQILFIEFCDWAIKRNLDLDDDDNDDKDV